MEWNINFLPKAKKKLDKLPPKEITRILKFLYENLRNIENPRNYGKSLVGNKYKDIWRFRVGDYRILSLIEDETITICVVDVGHRKDVYKDK